MFISIFNIIDNLKEIQESITYEDMLDFIKELDLSKRSVLVLNPLEENK